ncbi:ABC transporter permease [Schaalia sp. 19OD2882]|uniref:ABC transporter permease n=1 Tax=Schaalia sp. 19OD2882 TaxID=2794089 RepID=UPI001C1F0720|nr:ABC transporter permease [Schaalia sp. 19OD2882]QWW20052.1 ABC transporter permease [Schaalia sp. 19OD2882]
MIRAELLKLRRSMVWVFVPILPLLAVISGGVNYWMNSGTLTNGWDSMTSQVTLFYGMLFYSIGVAMVTAAVWRPEHRSSTWNVALTSGHSRLALVLTKAAVILVPVAAIQATLVVMTWAFGKVVGLEGALPLSFVVNAALVVVASVPLVLLQSLLSMLFKSFAAPVAVCLGLSIIAFGATAGSGSSSLAKAVSLVLPQAFVTQAMYAGSTAVGAVAEAALSNVGPLIGAIVVTTAVLTGLTALVTRSRTVFAH